MLPSKLLVSSGEVEVKLNSNPGLSDAGSAKKGMLYLPEALIVTTTIVCSVRKF